MSSDLKIVRSIKDLTKLFQAMQDFSVQSLDLNGIVIQRGKTSDFAQLPIYVSSLHNPSDSAAGDLNDQDGSSPQPPPPLSPESLESALYDLKSEFGI